MDRQISEKSYCTKRRKVLSNADSFLSSYSVSAAEPVVSFTTNHSAETCSSTLSNDHNNPDEAADIHDGASCSTGDFPSQQATTCGVSDIDTGTDGEVMSDDSTDLSDDAFPDETELNAELVKWYICFGVSLDACFGGTVKAASWISSSFAS